MKKRAFVFLVLSFFSLFFLTCQSDASQNSKIFSDEMVSAAVQVQKKYETYMFAKEGVKGVGIGSKDGQLAILVLVEKMSPEFQVSQTLDGVPIVIEEVGQFFAHEVAPGVSIGNDILCTGPCPQGTCYFRSLGTSGFKVCDNTNSGVVGFVTNNHVATSGCPGQCPNNAPLGTNIFSPSIPDSQLTNTNPIYAGALNRFVPIIIDGTTLNLVDAAFVISDDDLISDYIQGLGIQKSEIASPFIGQVVCKSGRTSGVTCGTITGVNITANVGYTRAGEPSPGSCGIGYGKFADVVMYTPLPPYSVMSQPGDSGAPVVDSSNRAVALNFAGNADGTTGLGVPIIAVLQQLQVSLCNHASNVSPSEGTIGTVFTINSWGFGTKKPKVYAEYEKSPGIYGKAYANVTGWSDSSVACLWTKKLPPGTYNLFVQPNIKGLSRIPVGTFTLKNPIIDAIDPNVCSIGAQNTIYGKFFSSKKPKVYLQNRATLKKYSCKVSSFSMNPYTGDSSLQFSVPTVRDLDFVEYDLILQNTIGQTIDDFCGLKNLTPYRPNSWSDKIVVSKGTGTNTDSSPLYPTDTLYLDLAVINDGTAPISGLFYVDLYLDGIKIASWPSNPPLDPSYYIYMTDYSLGSLSAGTHTLRIVADSSHAINESNEYDNEYTKTINVIQQGATSAVVNNYSYSISERYISPSSSSYWGNNWLSYPILPGSSRIISNIPPGAYDLRAVVSNGQSVQKMGFAMAAGYTYTWTVY